MKKNKILDIKNTPKVGRFIKMIDSAPPIFVSRKELQTLRYISSKEGQATYKKIIKRLDKAIKDSGPEDKITQ